MNMFKHRKYSIINFLVILAICACVCVCVFAGSLIINKVNGSGAGESVSAETLMYNRFGVVQELTKDTTIGHYFIIYDKDTKVEYLYTVGGDNTGISPLFNSDGSVILYEE